MITPDDSDNDALAGATSAAEILRIMRQRELNKIARNTPPGAGFRNTYSEVHAKKILPYFKKALEEQVNVCIPYTLYPAANAKRFRQIVGDSLSWIINNDEDETKRSMWAIFRTQIITRIGMNADEGIWIEWKTGSSKCSRSITRHNNAAPAQDIGNATVKSALITWLEGDRADMFRMTNLNLSLETQQDIKQLLEVAGVTDYKVQVDRVLVA